jgi:serine/threonine protein kinase
MPLTAGTNLGNYQVVTQLGVGGMGEVHRAHDTRLGRDVAIKVLPDELSSSPERLARFEREARIVASLNHPNIVTLYSIEEAAGTRFLTMELVDGRSLADMLAPGGLPLPKVLDIALAIADALDAAHRKGVVHRDLKPATSGSSITRSSVPCCSPRWKSCRHPILPSRLLPRRRAQAHRIRPRCRSRSSSGRRFARRWPDSTAT